MVFHRDANLMGYVAEGWLCVAVAPAAVKMFPNPWAGHGAYYNVAPVRSRGDTLVLVPLWSVILPCLLLTSYSWLPPYVRWQRRRRGLCAECGYLLRGLPTARCPECGRPFDLDDPTTFAVQNAAAKRRWDDVNRPNFWLYLLLFGIPVLGTVIGVIARLMSAR